jgi:hypothetical protein
MRVASDGGVPYITALRGSWLVVVAGLGGFRRGRSPFCCLLFSFPSFSPLFLGFCMAPGVEWYFKSVGNFSYFGFCVLSRVALCVPC